MYSAGCIEGYEQVLVPNSALVISHLVLQACWMTVRMTATQSLTCLLAPRLTAAVARKARVMVRTCCCHLTASQAGHQRRTGLLWLARMGSGASTDLLQRSLSGTGLLC